MSTLAAKQNFSRSCFFRHLAAYHLRKNIFLVHHNRKEHDGSNVFNDMTGSTGIVGVADTCMVLHKEDRFGNDAVLSITGRDLEEKRLSIATSALTKSTVCCVRQTAPSCCLSAQRSW